MNLSQRRKTDPDAWIDLLFSAKAARGGVVRRAIGWVLTEVGHDRFAAEVRRRSFHLLVTQNQHIIICNPGSARMLF